MRAVRFGSYSTVATLAGTPILLRLKSMRRKRRLWPPPRKREVMRPKWLRPPVRDICSVSDFSGSLPCESSEKSGRDAAAAARRGCVVWTKTHGVYTPSKNSMFWPGAMVTMAFFQFGRLPMKRPIRFSLPRTIDGAHGDARRRSRASRRRGESRPCWRRARPRTAAATSASRDRAPSLGLDRRVSLRRVPFSVSSGRLMICSGERMTSFLTPPSPSSRAGAATRASICLDGVGRDHQASGG